MPRERTVARLRQSEMTTGLSQQPASAAKPKLTVSLRVASKPGAVKAHADVRIDFINSALEIFGLSVVQHDPDKPAWVSYPQRTGKNGKYYTMARVTGKLHQAICYAVLDEFQRMPDDEAAREPAEDNDVQF